MRNLPLQVIDGGGHSLASVIFMLSKIIGLDCNILSLLSFESKAISQEDGVWPGQKVLIAFLLSSPMALINDSSRSFEDRRKISGGSSNLAKLFGKFHFLLLLSIDC